MKMNRWLVAAVLLVTTGASAARYGTAGCGLGAVVFGDDPGFVQVIAATLNGVVSGNQTFGMSTGTLECGNDAVKEIKRNTQRYIEGNRELVARDIARGQGDTIVGLSAIAGCKDTQKVGAVLQSRYETIFPTGTEASEQVTETIIGTLKADPELACQELI